MMKALLSFFVALSVTFISPIWPLEPNPLLGDPFIIVNKATNKLAFISNGKIQYIKPVATGKEKSLTPEGKFTMIVKAKDPYYRKLNIPGGAPNNPLGSRWIGFDALHTDGRTYGIHGTNEPSSIGKYISKGCIRMNNEDVEQLYDELPLGTKILVISSDESFAELAKQHGAMR